MGYDPMAHGARCGECILAVLRDGAPVGPELKGAPYAVVAEAPGETEIRYGRPLVGPSGMVLEDGLRQAMLSRADVDLFNTLACRPPGNNLKLVRSKLAAENRARDELGTPRLPDPVDACRPRLVYELERRGSGLPAHTRILALGKQAYRALVPLAPGKVSHPSIIGLNGTLYDGPRLDGEGRPGPHVQIVPTVHPAYISRKRSFTFPFVRAIDRARRWFTGHMDWTDPEITVNPDPSELASWEHWIRAQDVVYCDVETDSLEPCHANLKTIQMGTAERVVILALRNVDNSPAVTEARAAHYLGWAAPMLADPTIAWAGHNYGMYDRQVFQAAGIPAVLDFDTVILHRYVDPDLPHTLGFVAATYTDTPEWKSEGDHDEDTLAEILDAAKGVDQRAAFATLRARREERNERFWHYGGFDVATNARSGEVLLQRAHALWAKVQATGPDMKPLGSPRPLEGVPGAAWCRKLPPDPVLFHDHQMQAVCVKLHQRGMLIDQERRQEHADRLQANEAMWIDKVQDAVAKVCNLPTGYRIQRHRNGPDERLPLFNPRSPDHLRRFLFDVLDLPPPNEVGEKEVWTDSEERSTSDLILRAYLCDMTLGDDVHRAIHAIRRAKKFRTLDSRVTRKLCRPEHRPSDAKWLAVWDDGRLRVNWSVHTTGVGRLSSGGRPSSMNAQTIPSMFRDCFVAGPGNVLVGADLANIHLRLIANLWAPPSLVDDYLQNRDPHVTLATMIFGDAFLQADGWPSAATNGEWKGTAKMMRNVAKALRYAGAYGAQVPTIHATMTRAEDKDGNLLNRTLTQQAVRGYYNAWMGQEPEWKAAWDREVGLYRKYGYVLSPILGRRADFTDGEEFNKLANFRILSGEADIMGPATVRVDNRLRELGVPEHLGLIGQFHDAMLLEVPERFADAAKQVLEDEMNVTVPGWQIPIVADAKIGHMWSDVN